MPQHTNENPRMPTTLAQHRMFRNLRGVMALVLGGMLWLMTAGNAQAQSCSSSGSTGIDFGAVSTAVADANGTAKLTCQGVYGQVLYFRWCMFIPEGSPIPGIAPRWMTNYNGGQMKYDLYSDPARSQIIGPPPTGGPYAVYTGTLLTPDNSSASQDIPIYGRVPAGQSLPTAHGFQSQINGAEFVWAASSGSYPASCFSGTATGTATFYLGVKATATNTCSIAISQATNLDFGAYSSLAINHDSTSTISLACPANTSWKVGLNNGSNASAAQRRMKSPAGNFISYELYRNNSRTQRWGNDTTGGSDTVNGSGSSQTNPTILTVYGRTPSQAIVPAGTYTDTITVTLTY